MTISRPRQVCSGHSGETVKENAFQAYRENAIIHTTCVFTVRFMLIQVLYTSRSIFPRGDLSDIDILRQAAENNRSRNISGALLRDERRFLQILEGDTLKVLPLLQQIQQDPRHFDMAILFQRSIKERTFGSWSMGYAEIDAATVAAFDNINKSYTDALEQLLNGVLPDLHTPALGHFDSEKKPRPRLT